MFLVLGITPSPRAVDKTTVRSLGLFSIGRIDSFLSYSTMHIYLNITLKQRQISTLNHHQISTSKQRQISAYKQRLISKLKQRHISTLTQRHIST